MADTLAGQPAAGAWGPPPSGPSPAGPRSRGPGIRDPPGLRRSGGRRSGGPGDVSGRRCGAREVAVHPDEAGLSESAPWG